MRHTKDKGEIKIGWRIIANELKPYQPAFSLPRFHATVTYTFDTVIISVTCRRIFCRIIFSLPHGSGSERRRPGICRAIPSYLIPAIKFTSLSRARLYSGQQQFSILRAKARENYVAYHTIPIIFCLCERNRESI